MAAIYIAVSSHLFRSKIRQSPPPDLNQLFSH